MSAPQQSAAVALLELGRLLLAENRNFYRPSDEELRLLEFLTINNKTVQAMLNYYDSRIDAVWVQLVALVAYVQICTKHHAIPIADAVRILTADEPGAVIQCRKMISGFLLTKRLQLMGANGLGLGSDLLVFFSGGRGQPPVVITKEDLEFHWRKSEAKVAKPVVPPPILSAKQLEAKISESVIGLETQVRTVSCRLALHQRRAAMIRANRDPGTPNEALLFIGESGCGKTWLAETAGRACGLPFGSSDCTSMTAEGYVGLSVDDAIKAVITDANGDIEKARFGLCFADEFDKRRSCGWEYGSRDVGGASVQQVFLKLMEGFSDYTVGGRKGSNDWAPVNINTKGMFFIFAGAFVGLDEILNKVGVNGAIGFGGKSHTAQQQYLIEALISFGLIEEFVNRLTGILAFPSPTTEQLIQITERAVLPSYQMLLAATGADVQVSHDAIVLIAECAKSTRTYARGIKALVIQLLEPLVFEEFTGKITFSRLDVRRAIDASGMKIDEDLTIEVPTPTEIPIGANYQVPAPHVATQ